MKKLTESYYKTKNTSSKNAWWWYGLFFDM